jgi:hypothetical protein
MMLSPRIRLWEETEGACREIGVSGRGGDGGDGCVASEVRDLAFPLLYIPAGTVILRNIGS